jgi:ribosome-binding factor A
MPREFPRKLRIATELQRMLNDLLHTEVKDPRLAGVNVSAVEVSGDLGHAKVYFSTLDPDADVAPVEAAFSSAMGFIRHRVGAALELRRVPMLEFSADESIKRGMELSRLIEAVAPDEPADPESTPDDS